MPIRRRNGAWSAATLDAEIVAKSLKGERVIAAKDFFEGIMATALREDELLAEARLPVLPEGTKFGFNEFSRRAGDFAMSAALVTYRLADGKIAEARVGVGGAESSPRRIARSRSSADRTNSWRQGVPRRGGSSGKRHRSAG